MKRLFSFFTLMLLMAVSAVAQGTMTITPADGSTVGTLNKLKVTYSDYSYIYYTWGFDATTIKIQKDGTDYATATGISDDGQKTLIVEFNKLTEAGKYTISVPAGAAELHKFPTTDTSDALTVTVTIDPSLVKTTEAVFSPASGSTVHAMDSIRVSFKDYSKTTASSSRPSVYLYKDGVKTWTNISSWGTVKTDGDKAVLPLSQFVSEPGTYTLTFPDEYFSLGDNNEPNTEATYTFTVEQMPKKSYYTTPANDVVLDEITGFSLWFSDVDTIQKGVANPVIYRQETEEDEWQSYRSLTSDMCTVDKYHFIYELGDKKIVGPGIYHIVIPNRTVNFNGSSCEYFVADTLTLRIEGDPKIIFTPADSSKVDYLSSFTFVYGGNIGYNAANRSDLDVKDANGNVVGKAFPTNYSANRDECEIQLKKAIHTPGTYTIEFPDSTFNYNYNRKAVPAGKVTYTVTGETTPTNVVFSPADGSEIMNADTISITFPDYDSVEFAESYINTVINNSQVFVCGLSNWYAKTEGNTIKFGLSELMTSAGEYAYYFPAGTFLLGADKVPNTPLALIFTVKEHSTPQYICNIVEASTINEMDSIVFTFPEATSVGYFENDNNPYVNQYYYDEYSGEYVWSSYAAYRPYSWSGNTFTPNGNKITIIPASPITDKGEYDLFIPAGFFYFNDDKNDFNGKFDIKFNVDPTAMAIQTVGAPAASTDKMYDITGRQIVNPQKGQLYIVNGKKYIKK